MCSPVVAVGEEDLFGVLAELGGGAAGVAGGLTEGDGHAHLGDLAELGVRHLRDVVVLQHLGVVPQLGVVLDRRARYLARRELLEPVFPRLGEEDLVEDADELFGAQLAGEVALEAALVFQVLDAHDLGEIAPVAVGLGTAERQPVPVAALVDVPQGVLRGLARRVVGHVAVEEIAVERQGLHHHDGAQLRGLHVLPHAETLPRDDAEEDAVGEDDGPGLVGLPAGDPVGEVALVVVAHQPHVAAPRRPQNVHHAEGGVGALRPQAVRRSVDDARVDLA